MDASLIEKLLERRPFVAFSLSVGSHDESCVGDPRLAWVESEREVLFVQTPRSSHESGSTTIIDLRAVRSVVVDEVRPRPTR